MFFFLNFMIGENCYFMLCDNPDLYCTRTGTPIQSCTYAKELSFIRNYPSRNYIWYNNQPPVKADYFFPPMVVHC